jgi:ABC-type antimicrobial peptide transport system permease subunit
VALVIRTDTDPLTVAAAVRREIHNIDPDQGVLQVDTMESVLADSIARPRFQAVLLGAFGILALVLASVGLYGVISYSVEQRRREMGVRLALGAEPRLVARLVLREGLTLTIAGLALGLAASLGVTRYLRTLLFEVQPTDPAVFAFVSAVLILTSAAACYVPARRATRVDPALVLRDQ